MRFTAGLAGRPTESAGSTKKDWPLEGEWGRWASGRGDPRDGVVHSRRALLRLVGDGVDLDPGVLER